VNDLTTPSGTNDTEYFFGTTSSSNNDHQPHYIDIGGVTTDTFTYENNGNLETHNAVSGVGLQSYDYDQLNRLTSVTVAGDTTEFAYDPGGQRLYTEEPDGTIRIYLDNTEVTVTGGVWTIPAMARQYTTGNTQLAIRNSLLPELQYTFGNHQGSSAIIVDDDPSTTANAPAWQLRTYTPYGDTGVHWQINNPQLPGNNQRFLNQYHDTTTDLAYLNARYYNPKTRLFTQPDPLRQINRPQATNAYSYAHNNPNNLTDPTGLDPCDRDPTICGGSSWANTAAWEDSVGFRWADLEPIPQPGFKSSLWSGLTAPLRGSTYVDAGGAFVGMLDCISAYECGHSTETLVGLGSYAADLATLDSAAWGETIGGLPWAAVGRLARAGRWVPDGQRRVTAARSSLDIDVNPTAPGRLPIRGRPIGRSTHNSALSSFLDDLPTGASDIRVNQQQVNAAGQRVGINRPDLQFTIDGQRYYLEWEGPDNPRGADHADRILANDPAGAVAVHLVS
jgi:RHS repeat-associated protein